MTHKFNPENWQHLESEERQEMLPPEQILDQIRLRAGQTMVDVGAGTGYFAIPAAERVGPEGKVYAVDVAPEMLDVITAKLEGTGLPVELVQSEETSIPLDDGVADHVFTSTVMHEVVPEQRIAFVTELARLLKPGGRLTILDWAPVDDPAMGPPARIRLSQNEVEALLDAADVTLLSSESFGTDLYIVQGRMGAP